MKNLTGLLPLFPILLLAAIGAAAQEPLGIVVEDSRIEFESRQMGVAVRGHFDEWEAKILLDEEHPEASTARLVIQTDSIRTGHSDTDREVRGKNWLHVAQFPEATFVSDNVQRGDDGGYSATGTLRIRDREQEVTVPFTLSDGDGGNRELSGSFIIRRADFDVGGGMWGDFDVVANEVNVEFLLRSAPQHTLSPE